MRRVLHPLSILVAVIVGVLLLLIALPLDKNKAREIGERVSAMYFAPPAHAAPPAAPVTGNGPTGYFPDQFVVKRWDESPLPPQF